MFREILEGIVERVGGGIGAVLMGYDGIAIDHFFKPCEEIDLQLAAVEYANVLKDIRNIVEILNTGEMEEVSIRTGRYFVIIRAVTAEYFVALTLEQNGNFGKGRYLLQREAQSLREGLL
ncbi:MAG: GTPase [Desulfuromonas sp.]|nr:MAG: GTPase [Desulfuromonas sp.]